MPGDASPLDIEDLRERVHKELEAFLASQQPVLDEVGPELTPMLDAASSLLSTGKRLRPAFAYWGWRGAGGDDSPEIIPAVASLELLQACALIHDDVMDGSDTRRGQPSAHRRFAQQHQSEAWGGSAEAFGAGAAILLGDLALAWADEMLFAAPLSPTQLLAAKPIYDRMRVELMAGQYLDLVEQVRGEASVDRALRVARFKAAKYTVERPLHLGATLAGGSADLLATYTDYGLPLGEAFQLRDDLLGVFGDPAITGKPAGDDLREGKRTVLVAVTQERCTPSQREVLDTHFGDPNLSESGLTDLRHLITETGAVDFVEHLIEKRVAQARAALAPVADPARTVLHELTDTATRRSE